MKLTDEQLSNMRELYISGVTIKEITKQFNVSRVTVNNHSNTLVGGKNGKTWKELRAARVDSDVVDYEKLVNTQIDNNKKLNDFLLDPNLSEADKLRFQQREVTIANVQLKLKYPKLKPSEYIALSKYLTELQDEMLDRDKVYIIPPPVDPKPEEFE